MEEIVDVRELVGVSLNARTANADSLPDRQVTLGAFGLANDLGRMQWRMKYGQDVKHTALNRAALLLASRIRRTPDFDRAGAGRHRHIHRRETHQTGAHHGDVIERMAYRAIAEWVADRCKQCRGRGSVGGKEQTPRTRLLPCASCCGGGRLMASHRSSIACSTCSGSGQLTERFRSPQREWCSACQGSGKQAINHWARAQSLSVTLEQYHRFWEARFESVHSTLALFDEWTGHQVGRGLRR